MPTDEARSTPGALARLTQHASAMTTALPTAARLMNDFVGRTGVSGPRPPHRYLWTDAFAVCNLLELARRTGEGRYHELALTLVEQVHAVLGRHRDPPHAPLSGLEGAEAARHPTRGGLRIGKPLPERRADEPPDDELEWERDGQYFHYLTRWMHALDQLARATGQPTFNTWALELARVAYERFVVDGRMVWKRSVDLTRPLVTSMGQHDPLEGYVTARQLGATAARLGGSDEEGRRLADGFAKLLPHRDWRTDDPLGIGGLLVDAWRLEQLAPGEPLVERLALDALDGARVLLARGALERPPTERLAFRELGLALGLRAGALLSKRLHGHASRALARLTPTADALVGTWADPVNRRGERWRQHLDINEVMLASALVPEGVVVLREPEAVRAS